MATVLRNILAIIAGLMVGGGVNMSLITLGPMVVPPPSGVDVTDARSLSAGIHLLEARHFVFSFLARALGTLAGALTAFAIAASNGSALACVVGGPSWRAALQPSS